jgi:hypothetical protein
MFRSEGRFEEKGEVNGYMNHRSVAVNISYI